MRAKLAGRGLLVCAVLLFVIGVYFAFTSKNQDPPPMVGKPTKAVWYTGHNSEGYRRAYCKTYLTYTKDGVVYNGWFRTSTSDVDDPTWKEECLNQVNLPTVSFQGE